PLNLRVERLTLNPGAASTLPADGSTRLFFAEAGSAAVALTAGSGRARVSPAPARDLGPGKALVLPLGASAVLRDTAPVRAVILSVTAAASPPSDPVTDNSSRPTGGAASGEAVDILTVTASVYVPPGQQLLAGRVRLGRLAALATVDSDATVLLVVE